MKLTMGLLLGLLASTVAAAEMVALPYVSLNAHDILVAGPSVRLQRGDHRIELAGGYAPTGGARRGHVVWGFGSVSGSGTGCDVRLFHEVEQAAGLLPLGQTRPFEGRTGASAGITRYLGLREHATLSLTSYESWAVPPTGGLPAAARERVRLIGLSYERDRRDDPIAPRRGECFSGGVEQAIRTLGGTRSYFRADATWATYSALGTGVLAGRLHAAGTGGTLPLRRQILLPMEGIHGYDGVSNGGDAALVANVEARFPLLKRESVWFGPLGALGRVEWALFADAGTVHCGSRWTLRSGVGAGLRVPVTFLGRVPLVARVDLARGLNPGGRLKAYATLGAAESF